MPTFKPTTNDSAVQSADSNENSAQTGRLIINADDWGRDRETTDRTLDCTGRGAVSSVSAMVFMEDSERAAAIARDHGIDAGLHLNFTSSFSAPGTSSQLLDHQKRVSQYLRRHRFSQIMFHPGLMNSFEYVLTAQRDEFVRLYGHEPERIDGHHHMHLCGNVLFGGLLPSGIIVRRNFSFEHGEKSFGNRCYRQIIDMVLNKRYRLTDFFFSIQPLVRLDRLERIINLSGHSVVEVETHPQDPAEHSFLTGEGIDNLVGNYVIASRYDVDPS
jgi:predicted glycoside hydrolase/deacetylase ChbG (UPF0249 family)